MPSFHSGRYTRAMTLLHATQVSFCSYLGVRTRHGSQIAEPSDIRQRAQGRRADQGPRAIPEQKLDEQRCGPEGGIFPAAVLVGEEPAVLSMHRDDGAK